jgi:NADH:ubiquinone oxidoreductase subunit H
VEIQVMTGRSASEEFAARPWLSAVLAGLVIVIGILFMSGWVPASPNRRYFTSHAWLMTLACAALAVYFANCARIGFGRRRRERRM